MFFVSFKGWLFLPTGFCQYWLLLANIFVEFDNKAFWNQARLLFRSRQQKYCRRPTTQHTPAEHWGAYCKQDRCHSAANLWEQAFHQRPTGDPLHNWRQTNDSQIFISWFSPEQESHPCHVCPRAVGMVTGWSVSRTIKDCLVVRRHCRIQAH